MRIIGSLFLIFGGLYVVLLCFLYFYQAGLIFFPETALRTTPDRVGLKCEEVTLDARGTSVHGWFVPATDPGAPVVLFCHGNAGNIADRIDFLEHLHGFGLAVLIFDYAGYGRSAGKPSETQAYADTEAAYQWLLTRGYREENVILYGRSLGGAVAAFVAQDRSVRALVLEATFTSAADMAAAHYPWVPVRLLLKYKFAAAEYVRRARAPVFVIASPQDEIVPFDLSVALFQQAPEPKQFIRSRGGHNMLAPVDWGVILEGNGPAGTVPSEE